MCPSCAEGNGKLITSISVPVSSFSSPTLSVALHWVYLDPGAFRGFTFSLLSL